MTDQTESVEIVEREPGLPDHMDLRQYDLVYGVDDFPTIRATFSSKSHAQSVLKMWMRHGRKYYGGDENSRVRAFESFAYAYGAERVQRVDGTSDTAKA